MDDSKTAEPQQNETRKYTGARHSPALWGPTGGLFVLITCSLILFLEGFVTTAWSVKADEKHFGIWQVCEKTMPHEGHGWLVAVQVFACLSLVGIIIVVGIMTVYVNGRGNTISKNMTIVTLAVLAGITAILMFVTIGVYGTYMPSGTELSWSFFLILVAAILCLLAVPVSIVQAKRSNVRDCGCYM